MNLLEKQPRFLKKLLLEALGGQSAPKQPLPSTQDQTQKNLLQVTATIDGTKVSNPIGLKGEKVALSCFIAYKDQQELAVFDKLINEIDMELKKIIPTSFTVAKMMLKRGNENALLLRLGKRRTESCFLTKGHISEVNQFDLGAANPDLFSVGVEVLLEKMLKEKAPELVWIYPDNPEIDPDEVKDKLSEFDWKG
jgi:hypothetical protein